MINYFKVNLGDFLEKWEKVKRRKVDKTKKKESG